MHFIQEAYKHCKSIALNSEALSLMPVTQSVAGIIVVDQKAGNKSAKAFIEAIAQHRHWSRDDINMIAA